MNEYVVGEITITANTIRDLLYTDIDRNRVHVYKLGPDDTGTLDVSVLALREAAHLINEHAFLGVDIRMNYGHNIHITLEQETL